MGDILYMKNNSYKYNKLKKNLKNLKIKKKYKE